MEDTINPFKLAVYLLVSGVVLSTVGEWFDVEGFTIMGLTLLIITMCIILSINYEKET